MEFFGSQNGWWMLHSLHNQISSSTHTSVVQGHVEFLVSSAQVGNNKKSVRLKSSQKVLGKGD